MLHYKKGHFGCLSWHLCATTTTLTLGQLGEHRHPLVLSAASATVQTGLGRQRRCKFGLTCDEVASITVKELFANS